MYGQEAAAAQIAQSRLMPGVGISNSGGAVPRDARLLEQVTEHVRKTLAHAQMIAERLGQTRYRVLGESDPPTPTSAANQTEAKMPQLQELANVVGALGTVLSDIDRYTSSLERI